MLDVKRNLTTMTDFYELTMSAGYLDEGYVDKIAVFDMFFRRVPDGGGYAIMAGLQQFIDAVDHLKFTGEDIDYLRSTKAFDEKFLTYLNPAKVMDSLMEFDRVLEAELGKHFSNPVRIRIIVHCGCALERIVTRSPLHFDKNKQEIDTQKLSAIQKAVKIFEKTLKLRFDADELCFMAEMI